MWVARTGLVLLVIATAITPAGAEPTDPVLPGGALDLSLSVETELSLRRRFDVISAAPDIRWGVTDYLTLGLTHSMAAGSRVDSGGGFCSGCDSSYGNAFFDLAYNVFDPARAPTVARLRFGASSFDPTELSMSIGAAGRYGNRRLWLQVEPILQFGLNRKTEGNENQLEIPVWIALSVSRATVFVRTGIGGPMSALGDEYRIPLGLGASVALPGGLEVGAEIGFPRLFGPLNSEKFRHGLAFVRLRL